MEPITPPSPRAAGIRDRRTTLRGLFTTADTQHNVRGTRREATAASTHGRLDVTVVAAG